MKKVFVKGNPDKFLYCRLIESSWTFDEYKIYNRNMDLGSFLFNGKDILYYKYLDPLLGGEGKYEVTSV